MIFFYWHLPWIYTVCSSSGLVQYRSSFLQCTLDESLFPVSKNVDSYVCVHKYMCVHLLALESKLEHLDEMKADFCLCVHEELEEYVGADPFLKCLYSCV